jgi:hypothetical protein
MPETKPTRIHAWPRRPQTVPRAYAGRWVAWSPDGLTIVAVGDSFEEAGRVAAEGGFPEVAVERMPVGRQRETGTWL